MTQFRPFNVMALSEITHIICFPRCQTKMGICLHEIIYESACLENEVCFRELGIVSPRIISSDTPKRRCMLVNNHARKQFFWKEWSLFWSAAVICLQWLCRLVLEDNGRLVVKDPCELYTHALHKQVGPTPPPIVNTALALAFSMSEKVSSWRCEGAISGES